MAPVKLESREEQLANHMANFVYRETLEDQIKATDCEICMEPMGTNASDGPARPQAARSTPFYVDYCGNGHYFHKWCARTLLLNAETTSCPDCRAEPADVARISIAQSYPMPGAAAPSAERAGPVSLELDEDDHAPRLVRWRFWIKGAAMNHELEQLKDRMRANFIAAMRHDVPEFEGLVPPGSDAFEGLLIHMQYEDMTPPDAPRRHMWVGTYRCEFLLSLPRGVANAFLQAVNTRLSRGDTWASLVKEWFRYAPIHWQRGRDEPRIDGGCWVEPTAPEPRLSKEEFDVWEHWYHIQRPPRFRAIGEDRL